MRPSASSRRTGWESARPPGWADRWGARPGTGPRPPESRPFPPPSPPEWWRGRRAVHIPPRPAVREAMAGIGALLALIGLIGGVPYALLRFAGPPFSPRLLEALVHAAGWRTVAAIIVLVLWLAWFQLFVCVLVEVYAGLLRTGAPVRVPLAGGAQDVANRLVSAVLGCLGTAAAAPAAQRTSPVPGSEAAVPPDRGEASVDQMESPVGRARRGRPGRASGTPEKAGNRLAGRLAVRDRDRLTRLWRRASRRGTAREEAVPVEAAVRLGADAPGGRMLDLGLRLLGGLLAERGGRLPTIHAVHVSHQGIDLWIHPADEDAPGPWQSCDGGQVWRLPAHEGRRLDEPALSRHPAPYPGLVTLGTGHGGRVLIDLDAAPGVIGLTGAHTVAALSALAVELATNRWSHDMRITLVGFGAELAELAPGRIRVAGSLTEVLRELEHPAAAAEDVLTGRPARRAADPVRPRHYLLSAIRPGAEEIRRLAPLVKGPRPAYGFVVAGEAPHTAWTWEITEDGRARVDALGLEVTAQLLPRGHYAAVIDLFRTAAREEERWPGTPGVAGRRSGS